MMVVPLVKETKVIRRGVDALVELFSKLGKYRRELIILDQLSEKVEKDITINN